MTMRILALGDGAFTVQFAETFDAEAQHAVTRLDAAIAAEREAGRLTEVIDTTPTFRSLSIHYDPLNTRRAELEPRITALAEDLEGGETPAGPLWRFPVAYGGEGGPDLDDLAEACGITPAQAIDLHASTTVDVYTLGFLPGFAFIGDIPEALRLPRLTEPRVRVPAGSVAVADRLTAIYPWESPGGWRLIGMTAVALFDRDRMPPALLSPADRVAFKPAEPARVRELAAALRAGELDPLSFREGS